MSSIKLLSEKIYTKPLRKSSSTLIPSWTKTIPKEPIRENIAKVELPSRPSRMEGLFIKNLFLKTQRKEK
jgi:hypothetical protein